MRKIKLIVCLLIILIPTISFGQLFPSIEDFNGEIEKVVDKRYGKEVYIFNRWTGVYLSRCYSGWKYVYQFDSIGNLERRTNSYKRKLRADIIYKYDSSANVAYEREIVNDNINNNKGNYIEYEYILDLNGKIEKVNIWSYHFADSSKEIIAVGKDIKYDSFGKIISYYRHGYDFKGKELIGELYLIHYDSLSRVVAVEEKAIYEKTILVESDNNTQTFEDVPISEPELLKKWIYKYNTKGQVVSYTIKYYGELYKASSGGGQDYKLFFKYDNKNNWTKMHLQLGDSKKSLKAKRRIKYK